MTSTRRLFGLAASIVVLATACAGPAASPTPRPLTQVRLQLQWVTQSQFAGYFAALDQGFYEAEGLDV